MFNQLIQNLRGLVDMVLFNKPGRILRQITACKTVSDLETVSTAITLQLLKPNKRQPALFTTMEKYIAEHFSVLVNVNHDKIKLIFAPIPSLTPSLESLSAMYFVYDNCLYDSGLVACAFYGQDFAKLIHRSQALYGPEYATKHTRGSGPNIFREDEIPTTPTHMS